jgi:hypothetical protein
MQTLHHLKKEERTGFQNPLLPHSFFFKINKDDNDIDADDFIDNYYDEVIRCRANCYAGEQIGGLISPSLVKE